MHKTKTPAGAASAAYRNANKKLAKAVGVDPMSGPRPSADFEMILEAIPDAMREKALEWYERGIRRGIAYATDRMADGTIQLDDDGSVIAPDVLTVKVWTRIKGKKEHHVLEVEAEEVGFSK